MMYRFPKMTVLLTAFTALSASSAYAGFYMEGLEPFVMPYCDETTPSGADVTSPGIDWETMTPDETYLENGLAYTPADCAVEEPAQQRVHKKQKSTYKVPQK